MLRARLKISGGKHRGKTIPLTGAKFLIGREQDCQLRPTSELISRHHCAITVDDFTVRLRDMGSTNGTYVNEERVHGQVTLKSGDLIRVGKIKFEILIAELSEEESRKLASSGSATALADILANSDTTELSGSETTHDVRLPLIVGDSDSALNQTIGGDSGTFELSPGLPLMGHDSALIGSSNEPDTTVAPHHALVPMDATYAGQPQQAGMAYQQPGPYGPMGGYPQMPGYPPMPMGYPQMPAYGYPQPGMYAPPMYPMPQPPAMYPPSPAPVAPLEPAPAERSPKRSADNIPLIALPDPAETGVKKPAAPAPEAAAPAKADGAAPDKAKKRNPSEEAADIIRQHMQRRPGT